MRARGQRDHGFDVHVWRFDFAVDPAGVPQLRRVSADLASFRPALGGGAGPRPSSLGPDRLELDQLRQGGVGMRLVGWEHACTAPLSGDANGFGRRYAEDLALFARSA